jgi:hypothetical protein
LRVFKPGLNVSHGGNNDGYMPAFNMVYLFPESDGVKLILYRLVEALADAVGLRRFDDAFKVRHNDTNVVEKVRYLSVNYFLLCLFNA